MVGDVLDSRRELGIEVFALDGVARDDSATAACEHAKELAFEVDALDRAVVVGGLQTLEIGIDAPPGCGIGDSLREQLIGLVPSAPDPARTKPSVHCDGCRGAQTGR